jgi:ribonuclease HII
MFIAGVLATERTQMKFSEMGCRDSKELSPARRKELREKIEKAAKEVHFVETKAKEVDALRTRMSMNELEARKMAELLDMFETKPGKVIIDCPDVDTNTFITRLVRWFPKEIKVVAEHKADVKYPIVSAASIVAKTERDAHVADLNKKYGSFGTGYPADERTIRFLEDYFKKHHKYPHFVRRSWETSDRIIDREFQKVLGDFW